MRMAGIATLPLTGALAISVALSAQSPRPAAESLDASGKEWPLFGGDWGNRRHSTLTQITPQNVTRLRGAWVSEPFLDGATSRSTAVVKDGLLYLTTQTRVYALDAATGRTVWHFKPSQGNAPTERTANSQFRLEVMQTSQIVPNTQGVAVGDGLVFVGLYGGEVAALHARTGDVVWRQQVGEHPAPRGQGVSSAPTYAAGVVFTGTASGDFGLRSRIVALDARTGRKLWEFFVIPGPGEPGHDTWPQRSDAWRRGGGGIWRTAAVDPALGIVYFVTGNPHPAIGGEVRPGDNLYTDSIVALDIKTGARRWHQQLYRHDVIDADISQPPVLYDVTVSGRMRKAIAAMRTDGYLFSFDRATGEPIIALEERAVPQDKLGRTAATQPFPKEGESVAPDCSVWKDRIPAGFTLSCSPFTPPTVDPPNVIAPGHGVRSFHLSYNPQLGYFYVQGNAGIGRRVRTPDPFFFPVPVSPVPGMPDGFGLFAAIDGRTGKVVWNKRHDVLSAMGGTLSTATGLLFNVAPTRGTIQVFDARTGDSLFELATGGTRGQGGAPSSYEMNGDQYLAIPWGNVVRAFKLNGTIDPPAVPDRAAATRADQDPDGFQGPIEEAPWSVIGVARMTSDSMGLSGGARYHLDEYYFNPYRTRVVAGQAVTWANNGNLKHTVVAKDGSWTTQTMIPGDIVTRVFDKPGRYTYICKEHPWAYGQIVVEDPRAVPRDSATARGGGSGADQTTRGRQQYGQACAACHGLGLEGGSGPALTGDAIRNRWQEASVRDLFSRVRNTMPLGAPSSLSEQTYLDVVAFLLRSNGFGTAGELGSDSAALDARPAQP